MPAAKRLRVDECNERGLHPLGVEPMGQWLIAEPCQRVAARKREICGLGKLHALGHQLLLELLAFMQPRQLANLSICSRSLRVFASHDELWRVNVVHLAARHEKVTIHFPGSSWREAYVASLFPSSDRCIVKSFRCLPLYSDVLFQPWASATMPIQPAWLDRNTIDRRDCSLSVQEFVEHFEKPLIPLLLRGAARSWEAYKSWTFESFAQRFGDVVVNVQAIDMTVSNFVDYVTNSCDEAPLYLFDKEFCTKMYRIEYEYEVPPQFVGRDHFEALGRLRPDYRWLIAGPSRSGSSWHIDPNASSAWNAAIVGRKKWILFPPGQAPPGVLPSADGANVTTPISIVEWFSSFYEPTEAPLPGATPKQRPVECIAEPGDVVFVPSGWWHTVLNLEPSIAITQNYASDANILNVLAFSRDKPAQVSGCDRAEHGKCFSLHDAIKSSMVAIEPNVIDRLRREQIAATEARMSRWQKLVSKSHTDILAAAPEQKAFTFRF